MIARLVALSSTAFMASACSSAPTTEDAPPLQGAGVVVVNEADRVVAPGPPGSSSPVFQSGMEFAYTRGGDRVAQLQVVYDPEQPFLRLVDTDTRMETWHDLDLAELGRAVPNGQTPILRLMPGDAWVHFPLGPGKRWTSEFASHSPGREAGLVFAEYHCEDVDIVTTPAGEFECLRIVRLASIVGDESGRARASVYWYAPQLGFVVRRFDNSQLLELQSYGPAETPLEMPTYEEDPPAQDADGSEESD